jgi:CBS domain containing-hemolysin-like protein
MLVLVAASGIFSASETSFFTLTREELRQFKRGSKHQKLVFDLMSQPDRVLTGILFWNLIVNLTYFAISVVLTKHLLVTGNPFAAGCMSVGALCALIGFGEVLPKSLAVMFRNQLSIIFVWPITASLRILDPIMPLMQSTAKGLRRGFWPNIEPEPVLDAYDLEQAVDVTHQTQELVQHEREVLHNILDLSEITVEEIMRPRGTYLALKAPIKADDLQNKVPPGGYVLVLEGETEHIQGAISLGPNSLNHLQRLERTMEKVIHVPWCAKVADVLEKMRRRLVPVVSVVNEYGETMGIVTYEDLIDTILDSTPSRVRRILDRDPIIHESADELVIEGMSAMRYLVQKLELDYDLEQLESVTVQGYIQDQLERLPQSGDECWWHGVKFTVLDAVSRGPITIRVEYDKSKDTKDDKTASTSGLFFRQSNGGDQS